MTKNDCHSINGSIEPLISNNPWVPAINQLQPPITAANLIFCLLVNQILNWNVVVDANSNKNMTNINVKTLDCSPKIVADQLKK